MLGDLPIVVAHDGDIVGNPQAQFMQRLVAADRHQVVGAEDRGRGEGLRLISSRVAS